MLEFCTVYLLPNCDCPPLLLGLLLDCCWVPPIIVEQLLITSTVDELPKAPPPGPLMVVTLLLLPMAPVELLLLFAPAPAMVTFRTPGFTWYCIFDVCVTFCVDSTRWCCCCCCWALEETAAVAAAALVAVPPMDRAPPPTGRAGLNEISSTRRFIFSKSCHQST